MPNKRATAWVELGVPVDMSDVRRDDPHFQEMLRERVVRAILERIGREPPDYLLEVENANDWDEVAT